MNVSVWPSPAPIAHPPRSNPFLRSSSDAPPLPCITPSTVTCVMVVSFKTWFLSRWCCPFGRLSWAAAPPYHEQRGPDPTPPPQVIHAPVHPPSTAVHNSWILWRIPCRSSWTSPLTHRE